MNNWRFRILITLTLLTPVISGCSATAKDASVNNAMLTNVTEFVLVMLSLGLITALFAGVLYFLLQGRLGKMNALKVTDGTKPLDGVPFYIKRGRLTHETSYLEMLTTCVLTAKKITLNDKDEPVKTAIEYVGTKTVSQSASSEQLLTELRVALAEAQQAEGSEQENLWHTIREKFEQLRAYDGQLPDHPLPVAGNVIKESVFVDYEKTLYINQHQPLSGSSDIAIDLAPDGTLTKAAAKATDNTFDKLLEYLPKDNLTSKGTGKPPSEAGASATPKETPTKKTVYELTLTAEQQYIRHIRLREIQPSSDRSLKPPIRLDDQHSWYQREMITDFNPKEDKPEDEKPKAPPKGEDKENSNE